MKRPDDYDINCGCEACVEYTSYARKALKKLASAAKRREKVQVDTNVPYLCYVCKVSLGLGDPDGDRRWDSVCEGCTGISGPRLMKEDAEFIRKENEEESRAHLAESQARAEARMARRQSRTTRETPARGPANDYGECIYCLELIDSCCCGEECAGCAYLVRTCQCHVRVEDPFNPNPVAPVGVLPIPTSDEEEAETPPPRPIVYPALGSFEVRVNDFSTPADGFTVSLANNLWSN